MLAGYDRETFIKEYVSNINEGMAAIFLGAGASASAGLPSWSSLMEPFMSDLMLDPDIEDDMVRMAQFYCNLDPHNRTELVRKVQQSIQANTTPSNLHSILASLPIHIYWTTNYDRLMETALTNAKKFPAVKTSPSDLTNNTKRQDVLLYKMHGDVGIPDKIVITKNDYDTYDENYKQFRVALSGNLLTNTFLFIGFSFTDPNLDYIMSKMASELSRSTRKHYCILRKPADACVKARSYAEIKLSHQIKDLERLNIRTVLISDFHEIEEILNEINRAYKQRNIFISGSISSYNQWEREEVEGFLYKLSDILISREYQLITGFGLGVGDAVISGALKKIYSDRRAYSDNALSVYPFPQIADENADLPSLWATYREDMISKAGLAIFLFGNKLKGGETVNADGMIKEFEIAVELGLNVIPVGATGGSAQSIYETIMKDIDKYYPTQKSKDLLHQLNSDNTKTLNQLIEPLMELITELKS